MFRWCWHSWGKWEFGGKYTKRFAAHIWQRRTCDKCGRILIRNV